MVYEDDRDENTMIAISSDDDYCFGIFATNIILTIFVI